MNKNIHVFISYSEDDNIINEKEIQWISSFSKHLQSILKKFIGRNNNILLSTTNNKQPKNNDFIINLIIIGENYVDSTKCIQEFNQILEKKEPLFLILPHPIILPPLMQNYEQHNFYIKNNYSGEYKLLTDENEFNYWLKLIDLANDIISQLPKEEKTNENNKTNNKQTIYISHTSEDQLLNRILLKKEFHIKGFNILPKLSLPANTKELEKDIKKCLEESFLSIHIIGEHGLYLNGQEKTINELQYELAKEATLPQKATHHYIWIPPMLEIKDKNLFLYIEQLKRNKSHLINTEIVQTPLEEFKNIIYNKIQQIKNNPSENSDINTQTTSSYIYLIHEKEDTDECNKILSLIKKNGFSANITSYSNNEIKNIETHYNQLIKSEGVIIYYSNNNASWLLTKLKDIIKSPGLGKDKPYKAKLLLTKDNLPEINKQLLSGFEIIKHKNNLSEKNLKLFFEKIGKQNGE